MIKELAAIFLVLTSFSFVLAGTSSDASSDFGITGCQLSNGGYLAPGECSSDRNFFCWGNDLTLYSTLDDYFACSYMKTSISLIPAGKNVCCPTGYSCSDDGSGQLVCNQETQKCSDYSSEDQCGASSGCCWIDGGCGDCPQYCSYYTDAKSCLDDKWGVANCAAMDTYNKCGEYFLLNGCACEWDNSSICVRWPNILGKMFLVSRRSI
jgi:hypothetical protein